MMNLCGVWWCSNTIYMASTFPKVKKTSSWKISSVSKEEVDFASTRAESHETHVYYSVITKRLNFDCPIVVSSECFEPNEDDLELNAVANAFSNIFQPTRRSFHSSRGDRKLLSFFSTNCIDPLFSLRGKRWKINILSRGVQKHSNS